jgi:hypothetical protein
LDDPKYVGKRSNRKDIYENYFDSNDLQDHEDTETKSGQISEDENEIMDDDLVQDENGDDSDENDDLERDQEIPLNIASENREPDLDCLSVENASSVREELRKIEEDER